EAQPVRWGIKSRRVIVKLWLPGCLIQASCFVLTFVLVLLRLILDLLLLIFIDLLLVSLPIQAGFLASPGYDAGWQGLKIADVRPVRQQGNNSYYRILTISHFRRT
mgnify:CR=1